MLHTADDKCIDDNASVGGQLSGHHLTADNDMITAWMDCHASDAARATNQLFGQGLLSQVVHPDMVLSGHKEEGFEGVEQHPHHPPPVLPEGVLRGVLGQLVHQHSLCVTCTTIKKIFDVPPNLIYSS